MFCFLDSSGHNLQVVLYKIRLLLKLRVYNMNVIIYTTCKYTFRVVTVVGDGMIHDS
jgi:hypothetical protein